MNPRQNSKGPRSKVKMKVDANSLVIESEVNLLRFEYTKPVSVSPSCRYETSYLYLTHLNGDSSATTCSTRPRL